MKVTVILNGDIETCCAYFTADEIEPMVRSWINGDHTLEVINLETDTWNPDPIAITAARYFRAEAYPLVYIDNTLVSFGALPSKKNLVAYLSGEKSFSVTEDDIIAAAAAMKYPPPEEPTDPV